jgi:hypothetical protein
VRLVTNAPESPTDVPAEMHVTGAPDVAASPASTSFGLVYTGHTATRNLLVQNTGSAPLNVSSVATGDPVLTASPSSFTLAISGSQTVTLTYAPTVPSSLDATVTITSDDPDEPTVTLAATGSGNDAPDVNASSASMGARLLQSSTETQVLRIVNTAVVTAASLHFDIAPSVLKASAAAARMPSLDLAKGEKDPRSGPPVVEGQGGPDAAGYRWRDSDAPGGPAFSWIEISGLGTPVNFSTGTRDDGNSPNIPLGFTFPFYGNNFTTVNVCTNGWVSFTSTATSYSNQQLPTSNAYPENMVGAFWDDLDLRSAGQAYTWGDGNKFVIEWSAAPHYSSGGPYTFEIILYRGGKIVYQYLTLGTPKDNCTIGIQNATWTTALQVAFNTTYLHDNMAIAIQRTPDWLSVTPGSGDVAGHQSADLNVTYNSAGLDVGTYQGLLHITTNDPDEATIDIPVTLQVVSPTDAEGQSLPASFALSMLSANPARNAARFMMAIPQQETVDVRVYNVRGEAVRVLSREATSPGYHVLGWDGRNDAGAPVASGVYFVRMHAGAFANTLRVTLLR